MLDEQRRIIGETRATRPAARSRSRRPAQAPRPWLGPTGRLMIIAADHPARGVLAAGDRPMAMANRADLLDRILVALGRPGVDGILGTADIIEDLLLLDALDGKVVLGSMNRGGLPGTAFEIDDRFTGYDAAAIEAAGLDGGKMLLRIDPADPATARHPAGLRERGHRPGRSASWSRLSSRSWCTGPAAGGQRPVAGRRDQVDRDRLGARLDLGLHLAEDPGGRRDGAGRAGQHAARAAARRRRRVTSPMRCSTGGGTRWRCQASTGWSTAGTCCTRPMTT